MEELKNEIVQGVIKSVPSSKVELKSPMLSEIIKGFLGHSHHSMSLDRYGDRFSTEVLWKEVINNISFYGVIWDDLKIDWKQRIQS